MTTTSFVPSDDEATVEAQFTLVSALVFLVQVFPEFVDVIIPPLPAATSLVPSDDEATEHQRWLANTLVTDQVIPEFVEMIIPSLPTATSLAPSADEATE